MKVLLKNKGKRKNCLIIGIQILLYTKFNFIYHSMKSDIYSMYRSNVMPTFQQKGVQSVGALTPITVESVIEQRNLDQLESLCEMCERSNLNPMWYALETVENKKKLLEIFQFSIKYGSQVEKIYEPDVKQKMQLLEKKRKQVKDKRNSIIHHKSQVGRKKEKVQRMKLQIQKSKASNYYEKLKKIRDKLIKDKHSAKENPQEQQPQYIVVQQPYSYPYQPYPYQDEPKHSVPNYQMPPQPNYPHQPNYPQPQNFHYPQQEHNLQPPPQHNLQPQHNPQFPPQNHLQNAYLFQQQIAPHNSPKTEPQFPPYQPAQQKQVDPQQILPKKKKQILPNKKQSQILPETKKGDEKEIVKSKMINSKNKNKSFTKSENSFELGEKSNFINSHILSDEEKEEVNQKSVIIKKDIVPENQTKKSQKKIKISSILKSQDRSSLHISEAASEKYDEVFDLEDSKIQGNTKIGRIQSNISVNSMITDYDYGSIMDMRLEQESKKFTDEKEKKKESPMQKIEEKDLEASNDENESVSYLLKSNQGTKVGEKKFSDLTVKVSKTPRSEERGDSPEDERRANFRESKQLDLRNSNQGNDKKVPLRESKQIDLTTSNQGSKESSGIVPFGGKQLKIKMTGTESNLSASVDEDYMAANIHEEIIKEEENEDEDYKDDFQSEELLDIQIHSPSNGQKKNYHRFCPLFNKTFSLKNQAMSIHSSNSISQIGSLKERSLIFSKSNRGVVEKKIEKKSPKKMQTDSDLDFDMIEMPENSMIAKPSKLKASTIKKSYIVNKNSPKKINAKQVKEEQAQKAKKVLNDIDFEKIKDDENSLVQTNIRAKASENQKKKVQDNKKKIQEIEVSESIQFKPDQNENDDIKEENYLEIISELTEKSSDLENREKKNMQKNIKDLINNKYKQIPVEQKAFDIGILKSQIAKSTKNKDREKLSSNDIIKSYEEKIKREEERIVNKKKQLMLKQEEREKVAELTLSFKQAKNKKKSSEKQDDLTYSQSLMQMNNSLLPKKNESENNSLVPKKNEAQPLKPIEQKVQVSTEKDRKKSEEDEKKQSKFAVQVKKDAAKQLSGIRIKSSLNRDDEVENAVMKELDKLDEINLQESF